jgi:hypothetical protein
MGADQIGYLTFLPAGKEAVTLVKKRVAEFDKLFERCEEAKLLKHHELRTMNPRWDADKAEEKAAEFITAELIKGINKLGVDTKCLAENACLDDDESIIEAVKKAVADLAGFDPGSLSYRDTAARRDKISGRDVVTVFAGEMSWGDEPDGGGYTVLKALDMTGLIGTLEDMALGPKKKRRKP